MPFCHLMSTCEPSNNQLISIKPGIKLYFSCFSLYLLLSKEKIDHYRVIIFVFLLICLSLEQILPFKGEIYFGSQLQSMLSWFQGKNDMAEGPEQRKTTHLMAQTSRNRGIKKEVTPFQDIVLITCLFWVPPAHNSPLVWCLISEAIHWWAQGPKDPVTSPKPFSNTWCTKNTKRTLSCQLYYTQCLNFWFWRH